MIKNIAIGIVCLLALIILSTLSQDMAIYINPSGLLLVVGGTLLGVLLAYPFATIGNLWRQIVSLSSPKPFSQEELVQVFVHLTRLRRQEGVRALEDAARQSGNIFLEMGVSLVADNRLPAEVRSRLDQEFDFFMARRDSELAVLSLMGRLAPAFGLAGTVFGLIRMLHTLNEPSAVAAGMSVALLTTFYGIMIANLIVLPLERKLKERLREDAMQMTLMAEGIMGLAQEENGAAIAAHLRSYRFAQGVPHNQQVNRNWAGSLVGPRMSGAVSHEGQ